MAQREVAPKSTVGGGGRRPDGGLVVSLEMSGAGGERAAAEREGRAAWAAAAGVAGVGLAGAGVLVWWAVAFHPSHQQLWMVPVGLVLLGTPLVAWFSLFASGAGRCLRRLRARADRPPVAPTVVPER